MTQPKEVVGSGMGGGQVRSGGVVVRKSRTFVFLGGIEMRCRSVSRPCKLICSVRVAGGRGHFLGESGAPSA
jgi:hypothetical protein